MDGSAYSTNYPQLFSDEEQLGWEQSPTLPSMVVK
jgi:hypothetical protein